MGFSTELDYILIPDFIITQFKLLTEIAPCDIPHPLLTATHHNITGLRDRAMVERVAEALRDGPIIGRRLSENELKSLALIELSNDLTGKDAKKLIAGKQKWLEALR